MRPPYRPRLAIGSRPPDVSGRVGTIVNGRLRIVRVVGVGPHGTVYEASDLVEERGKALKVLHLRIGAASAALAGPPREVRLTRPIGHPSVVEAEALGRLDDGSIYLVTELVQGLDLRTLLAEGGMSERRALRFVRDALIGIEAAHRAGIAHGNLKLENLIVSGIGVVDDALDDVDEPVRVLDVALARLFRRGAASELVDTESRCVAPEVSDTRIITARGDVYAIGVALADLLGVDPASALEDQRSGITRETAFVLWRALQRDPRDRFRNATEMRAGVELAIRSAVRR